MKTENSWERIWTTPNKFQYNGGSELNEETANYETFYRPYDPAIGRFTGVDPLASSMASWNPYQYAFNDPISYNDPNGDTPQALAAEKSELIGDGVANGGWNHAYAGSGRALGFTTSLFGTSGFATPGGRVAGVAGSFYEVGFGGGFGSSSYGTMSTHDFGIGYSTVKSNNLANKQVNFMKRALAGNGGYWHHSTPDRALFYDEGQDGDIAALRSVGTYLDRHSAWGSTASGDKELTFATARLALYFKYGELNLTASLGISDSYSDLINLGLTSAGQLLADYLRKFYIAKKADKGLKRPFLHEFIDHHTKFKEFGDKTTMGPGFKSSQGGQMINKTWFTVSVTFRVKGFKNEVDLETSENQLGNPRFREYEIPNFWGANHVDSYTIIGNKAGGDSMKFKIRNNQVLAKKLYEYIVGK